MIFVFQYHFHFSYTKKINGQLYGLIEGGMTKGVIFLREGRGYRGKNEANLEFNI